MAIRRYTEDQSEIINMSSLLDVMFILIIFFLATTTFQQEERDIRVSLPSDSRGQTLSSAERVIVVNVRKSGAYVVLNQQMTVEEMAEAMRKEIKKDPDKKVLVRADREALHGYVAKAIAVCKHAGVSQANIGYQLEQ